MTDLAIIGGTGLTTLAPLQNTKREILHTPYGDPSGPITYGELSGRRVAFLPRHGYGHTIPPHKVNYRANLWALKEVGVKNIVAVAAVGAISTAFKPGQLVVPDQIIDYTHSRVSTYFEEGLTHVTHIDFTAPYEAKLRGHLIDALAAAKIQAGIGATYAATQGPRLETAAEIDRLERDGCHIVGMTGMPEAALARELHINYAAITVVANMAAGRGSGEITMQEIDKELKSAMTQVARMLEKLVTLL